MSDEMPFGRDMGGLPIEPQPEIPAYLHYIEIGRNHVHDFHRLARTIAPPTDVYDCACGDRRRYYRDAFGPEALLPEVKGSSAITSLDWSWIERRGNHTLAMSEGRPY